MRKNKYRVDEAPNCSCGSDSSCEHKKVKPEEAVSVESENPLGALNEREHGAAGNTRDPETWKLLMKLKKESEK